MAEKKRKVQQKLAAELKTKLQAAGERTTARISGKSTERSLNRSKLLVSIVNQKDEIKLKSVLDDVSVSLSMTFAATGTAHSTVLDYLGIGETEKSVVFSLIPESDEDTIIREIRGKMSLYLVGRGISFTIPLSGVSEIIANGIASAASIKNVDRRKLMSSEDRKYDLVLVSVEANHVDEAMEAARASGAAGGTVIRARNLNNKKAEQFIGISLMEERELLMILTKKEGKIAIMEALSEKVGLKTEAGGIIFSIPVDRTAGISATDEEDGDAKNEKTDHAVAEDLISEEKNG
jgi:nitrogen regulatory protein PII